MQNQGFRHPHASHTALDVLGYRADGRPIFPIAGGADEGDGGTEDGQGTGGTGDTATDTGTTGTTSTSTGQNDDSAARIAQLEQQLADARKEAGKTRVNAKATAAQEARDSLAQEIGKALGLVKGDTPPTVEELTAQLSDSRKSADQAQAAAVSTAVELQVLRTATRLGADGDALLDSRKFCDRIDNLDPSDPAKFAEQVEAAIKDEMSKRPAYRTTSAGRSGAATTHTGDGGTRPRPTSLAQAVRARMGGTGR